MKDLSVWKYRIERALALQSTMHPQWQNAIDLYNCAFFERLFGGLDTNRVDVHFANWYISNLVPLVYFRDPFIFVKATHNQYSDFAYTMEKVINYYWRELYLKDEFKRCILSGLLMPPGWIKIGYTAKIGQDIAKLDEEEQKSLIKNIKETITGIFKEKEEKTPEEQGIINEYIKEENIFATWVSSWNMLMPEGYQNIHKMPYLIEIEDMPIIDFLVNPLYKNKDDIKPSRQLQPSVSPSGNLNKPSYARDYSAKDDGLSIIRLFHIEDKRSGKRYTISLEGDEPHFQGDMVCPEGFSYEPLYFEETLPLKDKANPYPPNVIQPILPQIIEQSMARTQMAKHRKRSGSMILAQKGLASDEDMAQISDTEQVQLLLVSNLAAFQMTQTAPLPADVFKIDEVIKQDLQMGTNMGQLMFQAMQGQRTATQARIGQSGLELKASARVDVVEGLTTRVARKIGQFAWWYLRRDKISEIIGEEVNEQMWPTPPENITERKKLIQAEISFRIDAGSTAPPRDETVDRKQFLDAISIAANIAPERLNKDETFKAMFKTFKYIPDIEKIVISNDNAEMQAAQQENQLMLQGMPQVVSPNENHNIHISVHQQVAGNELVDQHILEHGNFLGKSSPQEANKKTQSTNPEIVRQGAQDQSDVMQATENMGVGTGINK